MAIYHANAQALVQKASTHTDAQTRVLTVVTM